MRSTALLQPGRVGLSPGPVRPPLRHILTPQGLVCPAPLPQQQQSRRTQARVLTPAAVSRHAAATPATGGCSSSSSCCRLHRLPTPRQPRQQRTTRIAASGGRNPPDRLLLELLGGTDKPSDGSTSSTSSSSSGDGLFSSLDSPGALSTLRQGIINPNNKWYRAWWGLLIGAAAFTGIFVPWELGFGDMADMYSLSSVATWIDLTLVALFMADIGVSHFVAYETDEMMVDEPGAIAANYRRQRLALDIISAMPFDWIAYGIAAAVTTAAAASGHDPADAAAVAAEAAGGAAAAGGAQLAAGAAAAGKGVGLLHSAHAAAHASHVTALSAAAAGTWQSMNTSSLNSLIPAIACLKGLHLVRLYRVRWFFRYLEYDLTVSLLTVTVARNLVIVLYLTHWVACGFNLLARSGGYDPDLLVGLNPDLFASISLPEQYVYSLYWSVTTLAGNEWNGMDAVTDMRQVVANTFRASVFLLFNIALGAYILGTITLLVVKNDERTGRYRDLSTNLKTYSMMNQLPAELKDEMQEHLRLKFNHHEASDDQVLSIYPTTIRRRILRHLYLRHLRASYLFRGAPRKYLDSLLAASRLELFRPGVDLLAAGDAVNELFVVVAGKVELRSPLDPGVSQYDWGGDLDDASETYDPLSSMMGDLDQDMQAAKGAQSAGLGVYVGPRRVLGPGGLFGEISFFTEIPQMETVRSLSTVRVMVISRGAFDSIERNFPIASRLVLENLKRRSEAQVTAEFPGLSAAGSDLQHLLTSCPSSLMYSWASPELVELMMDAGAKTANNGSSSNGFAARTDAGTALSSSASAAALFGADPSSSSATLTARQELVLSNLVRVMAVINQHVAKQEEDRTTDFLYAATRGDTVKLRAMLQQGFNPDSSDYDGRTALMLACVRGHRDVVSLLLSAGANPRLDDNLGRSALLEACYSGHDHLIDTLKAVGASLAPPQQRNRASAATSSSSLGRISTSGSSSSNISSSGGMGRKLKQGRTVDLAAAGSFGSLSGTPSAVGADGSASDDGGDGSDDASHMGTSWALQLASLLCNCVYECNLPLLRRLLRAGAPVDIGDYDKRTALHISAAEGNAVMVRVLVEEGDANVMVQDRWGNTPLDEARRVGAALVVGYLEQAAVKRREAELARRAEQQRLLLSAESAEGKMVVKPVSNWRREQQLQQVLRSQEATELYRLRQVQAQQVRQLSSSWLGEVSAAAAQSSDLVEASSDDTAAAAAAGAGAGPAQEPTEQAAATSEPASQPAQAAGKTGGRSAAPRDDVGQLLQLAQQAQQVLTLKVEEMELDYVESLQKRKDVLLNQQQQEPPQGSADGGSVTGSSSSRGNGGSSSRRRVRVTSDSSSRGNGDSARGSGAVSSPERSSAAGVAGGDGGDGGSSEPQSNSSGKEAVASSSTPLDASNGSSGSLGSTAQGGRANSNNVVPALKLQQPVQQQQPASASSRGSNQP